jgi:hypothetical protein
MIEKYKCSVFVARIRLANPLLYSQKNFEGSFIPIFQALGNQTTLLNLGQNRG